jgi:hypothetical protein
MLKIQYLFLFATTAAAIKCDPGYYFWEQNGIQHCKECPPGCMCAGGWDMCLGCSSGTFSPTAGASTCSICPPGTTSSIIFNAGCDPFVNTVPCANNYGPLGEIACYPIPPPSGVIFEMPDGALVLPPQYLTNSPPYIPNKVPPYYDIDGMPMDQQSY